MTPLLYFYAGINRLFFSIRQKKKWQGRKYVEKPIGILSNLTDAQSAIISFLKEKYAVRFETFLNETNALRNYHLLYLLDQVFPPFQGTPPQKNSIERLIDVGSKNFYYAPALHAFFKPKQLTGIELDGFHLYRGFYSNASYAQYYAKSVPNTDYRAMNFVDFDKPVDGIVWFYPFVMKEDVVSWYLPLEMFEPQRLFDHAREILSKDGFLLMTNTDEVEFALAEGFMQKAGFSKKGEVVYVGGLLEKKITPFVSLWS